MKEFSRSEVIDLLARCHRRCCICHRFCGVKIELDHIVPRTEDGSAEISNAIPVCFECHAEIHSYNDKHPRGRKFRPEELRRHKEQWLEICEKNPAILIPLRDRGDVGPLQALIDELEFNLGVAEKNDRRDAGCPFLVNQFLRALAAGSIAILAPTLKQSLLEVYRALMKANEVIQQAAVGYPTDGVRKAEEQLRVAEPLIREAHKQLLRFLSRRY